MKSKDRHIAITKIANVWVNWFYKRVSFKERIKTFGISIDGLSIIFDIQKGFFYKMNRWKAYYIKEIIYSFDDYVQFNSLTK